MDERTFDNNLWYFIDHTTKRIAVPGLTLFESIAVELPKGTWRCHKGETLNRALRIIPDAYFGYESLLLNDTTPDSASTTGAKNG